MTPNITRYLNKTIFVSIPALFEDGTCRAYKLIGAELNGLWLQSDALTQRLLPDDRQDFASLAPVVFVPFAQIAGVLVTTGMPPQTPQEQPEASAGSTAGATGGTKPAPESPGDGQPKRKPRIGDWLAQSFRTKG